MLKYIANVPTKIARKKVAKILLLSKRRDNYEFWKKYSRT